MEPEMPEENDRPIMSFAQVCLPHERALRAVRCLLPWRDFLRAVTALAGYAVTPRALQSYGSPRVCLAPRPARGEGHKARYLHPEHTLRLAAAVRLRRRHRLPIPVVREVLEKLPARYFGLVIRDVLDQDEVRMLALGDASVSFGEHLILERYARQMAGDEVWDSARTGDPDEARIRLASARFDDWLARGMEAPSDLEGMENWLLEPRDHFLNEELVEA